jgi:hypothetical protein
MEEDDPTQVGPGAIPYSVNAPFFSENGVHKERFMFVPQGETVWAADEDSWYIPIGSVLMKQFSVGDRLLETRLMTRHEDGGWSGWSYRWREDQSDADLLQRELLEDVDGVEWTYPDRGQCLHCHTLPEGYVLGVETFQVNGPAYYPSTGRWSEQLATLEAIGLVANLPADDPANIAAMPDPFDETVDLEDRAKAYLSTNCASCHQPGGGGYGEANYLYVTPVADMNICDAYPFTPELGIVNARLLAPGDRSRSLIYERMGRLDNYRMHPYRNSIDYEGRELIGQWIDSLTGCP